MATSTESIDGLKDIVTPFGVQLAGVYKRSFGYTTLTYRLSVILTGVTDLLSNDEAEIVSEYGQAAADDLRQVISYINKLKNEIPSNRPLTPLLNPSEENDVQIWNDYLDERTKLEGGVPAWYSTPWIYCETYMYRRLAEGFNLTKTLQHFDPFAKQKKHAFDGSVASATSVAAYTLAQIESRQDIDSESCKIEFIKLMKLALWGNRCDLSLSAGVANGQVGNPLELLASLEADILVDDTDFVWNALAKAKASDKTVTLDIVLDNAGYELFTDLCLAAFLVAHKLAHKVRFYVKSIPWYVSDVTTEDFHWIIERMLGSSNSELAHLGKVIKGHLETNVWSIEDEPFWTQPFVFSEMRQKNPTLYAKLSEASLIIFKGDLNYRKLVGDINWEYTTKFVNAVQGFLPAKLVSLRTIKSDVCAGLKPGQGEALRVKDPNWMITGQYGLIQSADIA
ncbi:damage-control phosphatase ARMT1-like isoform X2 [Athalia rosae]|uniref:damage-control phosphatase ARMT1-like isoform X2 n=1 Tax=Athalia rosae TaxID=37344 RepID=UPI00203443F2|nr:damage-control phosphatase ARMT1-like isoform X2 [Athalia rosae]